MKQTTKNILGVAAIVLLSSGVAGLTTYKMLNKEKPAAFSELFQQNPNNLLPAAFHATDAQPVDLTQAAESSLHAVVHIRATQLSKTQTVQEQPDIFDFFFGDGRGRQRQIQTQPRVGFGSGVIISKDGYIVTNNHVVEGADEITVKLNDDRELKGRIIGTDPSTDLALIKIEGDDFPTIPVGDSDQLKVGEWVLAVGNPFNLNSTVTAGIVSAKARSMGANSIESFIQTDAAINRGNSGGALVNARGELVGINAMIYSQTGSYTGYGFAIPTTIMNKVVADLKEFGVVQRAQLGVMGNDVTRYIDDEKSKGNDVDLGTVNGVYVAEVQDNSTASEAGLRKGDVVIAVNGKDVKKMAELQEAISTMRPGDKVKITYMRNKKKDTVTAVLRNAQGNTKVLEQMDMDQFGAALKPLDGETKRQLNLPNGLEVVAVKKGKMADAGVEKGWIILQVNDRPMNTMEDFEEAVKEANRSSDRILWIRAVTQSGRLRSAVVELDEK